MDFGATDSFSCLQVPSTVDNVRESLVAKIEEVSEDEGSFKFETSLIPISEARQNLIFRL